MAQIDQIEVTQGDIDAAARYWGNDNPPIELRQAFARHRIASEKAGFLRGVKAGLEAAANEIRAWFPSNTLNEPRFAASKTVLESILALDPQAIAKETPDAD